MQRCYGVKGLRNLFNRDVVDNNCVSIFSPSPLWFRDLWILCVFFRSSNSRKARCIYVSQFIFPFTSLSISRLNESFLNACVGVSRAQQWAHQVFVLWSKYSEFLWRDPFCFTVLCVVRGNVAGEDGRELGEGRIYMCLCWIRTWIWSGAIWPVEGLLLDPECGPWGGECFRAWGDNSIQCVLREWWRGQGGPVISGVLVKLLNPSPRSLGFSFISLWSWEMSNMHPTQNTVNPEGYS